MTTDRDRDDQRIVFAYHLAREFPEELKPLCEVVGRDRVVVVEDRDTLLEVLPEATVLVAPPQPEDMLDRAPRLQAHIVPFAGVNRVPGAWYRDRSVVLANSHGNAPYVAERAVALMYAAAGRVVEFDRDLRQGCWHRRRDPVEPFDYWRSLNGASVAILGRGAIGSAIVPLVQPLAGEIRIVGRGADLPAVLEGVDVVFVALPLTPETRDTLTPTLLARTRQAVLVNVGRAEVIPEEGLYQALTDGTLYAAGLDVWYRSPDPFWDEGSNAMPSDFPFHRLANVVLSPHAGSHSRDGKRGQFRAAVERVVEFLTTGSIADAVDPTRGY